MRGVRIVLLALCVAAWATACGGSPSAGGAASTSKAPPATTTAEPASAEPGGGVDVSGIAACTLVTPETVADLAGGTLLVEGNPAITGPVCPYVVDAAGTTESYWLVISPAAEQAPFMEYLATDGEHEAIAGPWDEAYAGKNQLGEGDQVIALAGDYAVNAYGDGRREVMVEIAKQAIAGLP